MTHGDPGDEGDPEDTPEDGGLDVADCECKHDDDAADAEIFQTRVGIKV
jgi:hypothetical protein